MKYLSIQHKDFKPITLVAGDSIEFTYQYGHRDTIKVTNHAIEDITISKVLVIVTEDNGRVQGMVLMGKDYE